MTPYARPPVIGISGGGPSAIQFAIRHPEKCEALILWSALSKRVDDKEAPPSSFSTWLFVHYLWLTIKDPALAKGVKAYMFENAFPHAQSEPGWNNDGAQFTTLPAYPLDKITSPTLIVHGDADQACDISHAKNVTAKVPHAKLITLAGKDHGALFKDIKLYRDLTVDFLNNQKRKAQGL